MFGGKLSGGKMISGKCPGVRIPRITKNGDQLREGEKIPYEAKARVFLWIFGQNSSCGKRRGERKSSREIARGKMSRQRISRVVRWHFQNNPLVN